jgi:hypothetical protein
MMTEQPRIPDEATRKRAIEQIRASNRMLDELNLALDDLIAMIEADLREQRQERLRKTAKTP